VKYTGLQKITKLFL